MPLSSNSESQQHQPHLILDLIGPFVVIFCEGVAHIHAPQCIDHHANILTDTEDVPLYGCETGLKDRYIYELTGPNPGEHFDCIKSCASPRQLLILDQAIKPLDASACHLVMRAPRPDSIVPLVPEQIWIYQNNATVWIHEAAQDPQGSAEIIDSERARGVRFIYYQCPREPSISVIEPKQSEAVPEAVKSSLKDLKSTALGIKPLQYHVVFRFASNSTQPDEHHEDGYNCFQTMRNTIGEPMKWRVDFDDTVQKGKFTNAIEFIGGKHPVDCAAAILVAPDAAK